MGMYTGLRGWIKFTPEITKKVKPYFDNDSDMSWDSLGIEETAEFIDFSEDSRASFIPYGAICYMPSEWEEDKSRIYNDIEDKFYFTCSLKNYDDTIGKFITWVNTVAIEYQLEKRYEEWNRSCIYEMIDGKIYIKYTEREDDDEWSGSYGSI